MAIENEKHEICADTPDPSHSSKPVKSAAYIGRKISPEPSKQIKDVFSIEDQERYSFYTIEDDGLDVSQKSKELADAFSLVFNPNNILQKEYDGRESFLLRPPRKIVFSEEDGGMRKRYHCCYEMICIVLDKQKW